MSDAVKAAKSVLKTFEAARRDGWPNHDLNLELICRALLAAVEGSALTPRDERDVTESRDIVDLLTERRKFRYAGNCKCGKCCLVPHEMLCSAIDEIKRLRHDLGRHIQIASDLATDLHPRGEARPSLSGREGEK